MWCRGIVKRAGSHPRASVFLPNWEFDSKKLFYLQIGPLKQLWCMYGHNRVNSEVDDKMIRFMLHHLKRVYRVVFTKLIMNNIKKKCYLVILRILISKTNYTLLHLGFIFLFFTIISINYANRILTKQIPWNSNIAKKTHLIIQMLRHWNKLLQAGQTAL